MDRYKFRGKRLDNGEWVEGWYHELNHREHFGKIFIMPANASALYSFEVDPATVGQYTGLKDKNGKEIYEGDVTPHGYVVTYVDGTDNANLGMAVGWYEQRDNFESWRQLVVGDDIEVIGNIHDTQNEDTRQRSELDESSSIASNDN